MDNKISSPLPPLYARWFNDLVGDDIPSETRATCNDCAMCEIEGDPNKPGSELFNPASKCCTYLPRLFNFLVWLDHSSQTATLQRYFQRCRPAG